MLSNQKEKEVPFQEQYKLFVGFDWASDHHDIVAVDGSGRIVAELTFDETADGWNAFRQTLAKHVGQELGGVAVAVETCNGPAVERLLEMGCAVYPLNPKAAKAYRQRKSPMGAKCDRLDAWSFADALRTDGHNWRRLKEQDPLIQELRILCRDEVQLIRQRTALSCQLQAALHEYYPAALEAFDDWTSPGAWAFVEAFPTPAVLVKAGKRRWEKFLHTHKLFRPETYPKRLEIFARADRFCGKAAVTAAKSRLAVVLAVHLRVLDRQLQEYRQAIEALFAQHPDHDIFGSLPGAGAKMGPRLLSEVGQDRDRFDDAQSLQCYAGTAPVTRQSGKVRYVQFRRGCNKYLRTAIHLWAQQTLPRCAWADAYYRHKRQHGMSHSCAMRCLGQRWLKILWKMWQTGTCYDEALHTRNQVKHGSWVLQLT
jgi:transposase